MSYLTLEGIHKSFGDHVAVDGFDLGIERGELVSFLGPSGCGKTTTLRMIAGLEIADGGTVVLGGVDITQRPPNRRDVGMVFQAYALFPNMTVAQNIAFGLKVRRTRRDMVKQRVSELLELIGLPDSGPRYPHQLSGGMQQRVALARALAIEPGVLLLDEPLSALDAKIRVSLRSEIRAIQRRLGITTVYVTHDQEEALSMSDRIVVMDRGRIEQVGTPAEIYNAPATEFVARFVGTLNVLSGTIVDARAGRIRIGESELKVARPIAVEAGDGRVSLALRPEAVELLIPEGAGASNGRNRIPGEVEEVAFLGSVVRVRTRLRQGQGSVVADRFNDPAVPPPGVGDDVILEFPPKALIVVHRSPAGAAPGTLGDPADPRPRPQE